MPAGCCPRCGNGRREGHEHCDGCERELDAQKRPAIPGDNWRAAVGFRRRRR